MIYLYFESFAPYDLPTLHFSRMFLTRKVSPYDLPLLGGVCLMIYFYIALKDCLLMIYILVLFVFFVLFCFTVLLLHFYLLCFFDVIMLTQHNHLVPEIENKENEGKM